jgi:hypothetical protein
LTTGGPAVRIIGELDGGEVESARLEVQDWGTPWTEHCTTGDDNEALLSYARCFYFLPFAFLACAAAMNCSFCFSLDSCSSGEIFGALILA